MKPFWIVTITVLFCFGSSSLARTQNGHKHSHKSVKGSQSHLKTITRTRAGKRLIFDRRRLATVRKRLKYIAEQLENASTVGDWVNKTSVRKNKMHRRMHFNKRLKAKLPDYVVSDYGVSFKENKKAKSQLFVLFPDKNGIVYLLDGRNITPRKRESFKKWQRRVGRRFGRRRSAFWKLLLPSAYADMPNFDFAKMLTSMSNAAWENAILDTNNRTDHKLLLEKAMAIRQSRSLSCQRDGTAFLKIPFGAKSDQPIRVHPRRNPNDISFKVDFTRDFESNVAKASLSFDAYGRFAELSLAGTSQKWQNEALLPAIAQVVLGGDPSIVPSDLPSNLGSSSINPSDLVTATTSLRACNILSANNISTCDKFRGDSEALKSCLRDKVLKSKVGGGMFSRSPLKKMEPAKALEVKLQLLATYHDYPTAFRLPENFPSAGRSGPSRSIFRAGRLVNNANDLTAFFENGYDETDPFQKSFMACVQNVARGSVRGCDVSTIGRENYEAFRKLSKTMGSRAPQQRVSDLNETLSGEVGRDANCTQANTDNNLLVASNTYETFDMLTGAESSAKAQSRDLYGLGHYADIARACCSNSDCRTSISHIDQQFKARGTNSSD